MKEKTVNKNSIKETFYKTNPSGGISLIVLVITIIIIIILAATVIVSIVNNNPMKEANEARVKSDVSNMQSIFTNAVGKIMAENQDTIIIDAGALNTVTSGAKSAVGNAVYKFLDGTSGEIIFDTLEKDGLKYYTGKRLPLYNEKTQWYVDEDGIISLEVGNKKYGDGKIIKSIKIIASVIESEEFVKTKAVVKIEVNSDDDIESIKFGGNDIQVPERKEGKYVVEIEVTENGEYEIEAVGKSGGKGTAKVEVNVIDELNNQMQIKGSVTPNEDLSKGTLKIEIRFTGEVESIQINGESVTVPNKSSGKYVVNKEIIANGEYNIEVKAKDGTINKLVIKVDELADNMEIWNKTDMESFRNKVNKGATYDGKTVTVMADIDLKGSSRKNWTPIANINENEYLNFKGTFEGNNHKISGLYINAVGTGKENQALFSINEGKIQNVEIQGHVEGNEAGMALVCGINNGNLKNVTTSGDVLGWSIIGGCVGANYGTIEGCINKANVSPITTSGYYGRDVGGIAGVSYEGSFIKCTNESQISGNHGVGGIVGEGVIGEINLCINSGPIVGLSADTKYNAIYVGGIAGATAYNDKYTVKNCLNSGSIESEIGGSNCGGVVGYIAGSNDGYAIIQNCYNTGTISGDYIGGIVAKEGYSSSEIGTIVLRNNYFLKGCGATYGRPDSNSNAQPRTQAQIDELIKNISF